MKRVIITSVIAAFFVGCSTKSESMATSVVQLVGNQEVVGWNSPEPEKPKVKVVVKEVVKYKPVVKTVVKYKTKTIVKTVVKYKTEHDSDGDWVPDSVDKCPNTPKNLVVDHNGCPIITTLRINFDTNSYKIKKIYYPDIQRVAEVLKSNPSLKIEVAGYTDDKGSKTYNLKLSQKRAEAVKEILVKKFKIDPKRIVAKGYGEAYPLVPNTSDTNRALNRRVEIVDITNRIEPSEAKKTAKKINKIKKEILKKESKNTKEKKVSKALEAKKAPVKIKTPVKTEKIAKDVNLSKTTNLSKNLKTKKAENNSTKK
ncbi:MAG: OmpA family protein [Nautiliaceae bacterium]|jgi:OOP family OmpA-OmpF porin